MKNNIDIKCLRKPILDEGFQPAVLWNKNYREKLEASGQSEDCAIAVERNNGMISVTTTEIFPHTEAYAAINLKYIERLIKTLLWIKGGFRVYLCADKQLAKELQDIYSPGGDRAFDFHRMGKAHGCQMEIVHCSKNNFPKENEKTIPIGRNLDGCRIGFDLGGSDRKCAAVVDGEVVFSEEIDWDPYFMKDPAWHKKEINDSLRRAAAKMPRVDAIGGSSAGDYLDNRVRGASLFRGISDSDFEKHIVNMFIDIQNEWGVPLTVLNDGEVTALAGSVFLKQNGVLGIAMGTSMAVGYIDQSGDITGWINELAFAPIDYRDNAPVDEWSGDEGCGVQYMSQQAVARLAQKAGFQFNESMPFAQQLIEVQKAMSAGDERAVQIYESIGVYLGYALPHYAEFYDFNNLLVLGRVTSGAGGDLIISTAKEVLKCEFPDLYQSIRFSVPDEKFKRHGQAIAAAMLPDID